MKDKMEKINMFSKSSFLFYFILNCVYFYSMAADMNAWFDAVFFILKRLFQFPFYDV